jgi:hypothetical protein
MQYYPSMGEAVASTMTNNIRLAESIKESRRTESATASYDGHQCPACEGENISTCPNNRKPA